MKIDNQNADAAVLTELGRRLASLRIQRNLTQESLAEAAGVSKRTIERLETGHSVQLTSLVRVLRALELSEHLDQLIPAVGPSPIQQLELQGKERRRASGRTAPPTGTERWTWDDEQ